MNFTRSELEMLYQYAAPTKEETLAGLKEIVPVLERKDDLLSKVPGFGGGKPLADRIIPLFDKGGPVIRNKPAALRLCQFFQFPYGILDNHF